MEGKYIILIHATTWSEPQEWFAKWKKLDEKGHAMWKKSDEKKPIYLISYTSTYMKCLEQENLCLQEID